MDRARVRARARARVLVCFNWLSFPSRMEVGRARARARASARGLVCLIGFHFLILSLHLPSAMLYAPSAHRAAHKLLVLAI